MALTTFNAFSQIYDMSEIFWREVIAMNQFVKMEQQIFIPSMGLSVKVVPNIPVRLTSNWNFCNFWHNESTQDAKPYFVKLTKK